MRKIGDHAVVLGASMGGLLAARVLADAYQRVTVVDRDLLPERAADRQGVPQGRHAHALLARGAQILEELFPGLLADLAVAGVPVLASPRELWFSVGGHLLCLDGEGGDPGYLASLAISRRPGPQQGPGPGQRLGHGPVRGGRAGHHAGPGPGHRHPGAACRRRGRRNSS